MRRVCRRCIREFDDTEEDLTPAGKPGEIFMESIDERETRGICPDCREELGLVNLLGFEE